jgi:hypothetical protein
VCGARKLTVSIYVSYRGPEIEFWVTETGQRLYDHNDWSLLPFMALSDGAHAMVEDFSYFTLLHQPGFSTTASTTDINVAGAGDVAKDGTADEKGQQQAKAREREAPLPPREGASSLFGIACTRQIRSDRLKKRSKSVTRSSVQKSVVVVVSGVAGFGELRTRLGMVVEMWFGKL